MNPEKISRDAPVTDHGVFAAAGHTLQTLPGAFQAKGFCPAILNQSGLKNVVTVGRARDLVEIMDCAGRLKELWCVLEMSQEAGDNLKTYLLERVAPRALRTVPRLTFFHECRDPVKCAIIQPCYTKGRPLKAACEAPECVLLEGAGDDTEALSVEVSLWTKQAASWHEVARQGGRAPLRRAVAKGTRFQHVVEDAHSTRVPLQSTTHGLVANLSVVKPGVSSTDLAAQQAAPEPLYLLAMLSTVGGERVLGGLGHLTCTAFGPVQVLEGEDEEEDEGMDMEEHEDGEAEKEEE